MPRIDRRSAPPPSAGARRNQAVSLPEGKSEQFYDGAFIGAGSKAYARSFSPKDIPPFRPRGGQRAQGTILSVNGIRTSKETQAKDLQALADRTGMAVIGVHNATAGFLPDTLQSGLDKLNRFQAHWGDNFDVLLGRLLGHEHPLTACQKVDLSQNPAVHTLASTVLAALNRGEPVHLLGHSQGALVVSSALSIVKQRLEERGRSRPEAEALMGKISVETFGGAAHTYPDGPRYVHYVNERDGVPGFLGLGLVPFPGKNAVVKKFSDAGAGGLLNFPCHQFETYLAYREPFPQR
ncbi:MAG: hypothetical protein ACOZIN_00650 [Myxococcota bacterium]